MGNMSVFSCCYSVIILVNLCHCTSEASESDQKITLDQALMPTPLRRQETDMEIKYRELETKLHLAYVKSLHSTIAWKGKGNIAETLAWYDLLPAALRLIVNKYCNFEHYQSIDYDHAGWNQWKNKRFGFSIPKMPRGHSYTLLQQLFLVALFNEYNRSECDLPMKGNKNDEEVYAIYQSFRDRDKQLIKRIQCKVGLLHSCDKDYCIAHVPPVVRRFINDDPGYYFSYPRIMHVSDDGDVLLLVRGLLNRDVLLVRTRSGVQYHLDNVNYNEEYYGALWCNNEKYVIGIKKISIAKETVKGVEQKQQKDVQREAQDLDIGSRRNAYGRKNKKSKRGIFEYSSSNSSVSSFDEYLPSCIIKCIVWNWPQRTKREESIVVENFNADRYGEMLRNQDTMLHNYMYAYYDSNTRGISCIIPPYKRRWHYSFITKQFSDAAMPNLCEGVVCSNNLRYAICPRGPLIKYGTMNEAFSFSWWHMLRWEKYHSSKKIRAYNIADNGGIIGITSDGYLQALPSGEILDTKPNEGIGAIRDDWPVIISPNNRCAMVPVWSSPSHNKPQEISTRWLFWKFPESIFRTYSNSSSSAFYSSSSSSSSSTSLSEECCITM